MERGDNINSFIRLYHGIKLKKLILMLEYTDLDKQSQKINSIVKSFI